MEEVERRTKVAVSSLEHQIQLEKVDFENGIGSAVLFFASGVPFTSLQRTRH